MLLIILERPNMCRVLSSVVLIGDTLDQETHIIDRTEALLNIPTGWGPTSWLHVFTKHE